MFKGTWRHSICGVSAAQKKTWLQPSQGDLAQVAGPQRRGRPNATAGGSKDTFMAYVVVVLPGGNKRGYSLGRSSVHDSEKARKDDENGVPSGRVLG